MPRRRRKSKTSACAQSAPTLSSPSAHGGETAKSSPSTKAAKSGAEKPKAVRKQTFNVNQVHVPGLMRSLTAKSSTPAAKPPIFILKHCKVHMVFGGGAASRPEAERPGGVLPVVPTARTAKSRGASTAGAPTATTAKSRRGGALARQKRRDERDLRFGRKVDIATQTEPTPATVDREVQASLPAPTMQMAAKPVTTDWAELLGDREAARSHRVPAPMPPAAVATRTDRGQGRKARCKECRHACQLGSFDGGLTWSVVHNEVNRCLQCSRVFPRGFEIRGIAARKDVIDI